MYFDSELGQLQSALTAMRMVQEGTAEKEAASGREVLAALRVEIYDPEVRASAAPEWPLARGMGKVLERIHRFLGEPTQETIQQLNETLLSGGRHPF
jgi:hypothetical protein